MATSDLIANFILEALNNDGGVAELKRNSLAEQFSCVPSQINYVISTRFSPEHGYLVESRRGGSGYIRITRVQRSPRELMMHTVNAIGDRIDLHTAAALLSNLVENELIDGRTASVMLAAMGDKALHPLVPQDRDVLRAAIFKQMLMTLATGNY